MRGHGHVKVGVGVGEGELEGVVAAAVPRSGGVLELGAEGQDLAGVLGVGEGGGGVQKGLALVHGHLALQANLLQHHGTSVNRVTARSV